MAIDGTPPFKLPPGAQPIVLNDFDLLTSTQFPTSGAGPYTVPTGKRLVITGAHISWVENAASPPASGREVLIQVGALDGDGHVVVGQVHTIHGVSLPPTQFAQVTASVTNLALPVLAGSTVSMAITGTAPFVTATSAQVVIVWGWLEALTK